MISIDINKLEKALRGIEHEMEYMVYLTSGVDVHEYEYETLKNLSIYETPGFNSRSSMTRFINENKNQLISYVIDGLIDGDLKIKHITGLYGLYNINDISEHIIYIIWDKIIKNLLKASS